VEEYLHKVALNYTAVLWRINGLKIKDLLAALLLVTLLVVSGCTGSTSGDSTESIAPALVQTTEQDTQAEFKVHSLMLTSMEPVAGELITAKAIVSNVGTIEGTFTATLKVDGVVVGTEEVSIGVGGSKTVSFTFTVDVAGDHSLELEELHATFTALSAMDGSSVDDSATSSGVGEIKVSINRATIEFPDSLVFSLVVSSDSSVTNVSLKFGTDKRSLVSESSEAEPDFDPDFVVETSWEWQMKKTGSLPPGATVWWQWRIVDETNKILLTPRRNIVFEDTRYQWQKIVTEDLDVYWHELEASLVHDLTEGLEVKLSRLELNVQIPEERKPKIFVYPNVDQLRSAVLFTHEWTGALAYPDYNIILIPVSLNSLDWAKRTLAHEVTHLLVREATFGPFGDIPSWLNEGLAQYAEGEMESYQRSILDQAIREDNLISVPSLSGSFPTDPNRAFLAYAQSLSLVSYLIDTHGWPKIRQLLVAFKEGSTDDDALMGVYSFDSSGLEERWRAYIGSN